MNLVSTLRSACLVVLVSGTTWIHRAQTNQTRPAPPLWSSEVLQQETGGRGAGTPRLISPDRAGVAFLDDKQLIVHEVDVTGELSSRLSPEISSGSRLHASLLDADSGRVLFSRDWPTRARGSSIDVTSAGLVVRTGDTLRLYSKNFAELEKLTASRINSYDHAGWLVTVSPSRSTVLINRYHTRGSSQFDVLDGSTFKLRTSWTEPPLPIGRYSISDNAIAAVDTHYIILASFGTEQWKRVWDEGEIEKGCVAPARFVANDSLIYGCQALTLVSTEGQTLMRAPFDKGEHLEVWKISVAQNGRSVAVCLDRWRGAFWDMLHVTARHVAVYDLNLKKQVLTVEIAPLPKNDYDFALSPDGSKLAILNDRTVSVYAVPGGEPGGEPGGTWGQTGRFLILCR